MATTFAGVLITGRPRVGRQGRGVLQVRAASISSNDFRPGVYIEVDGAPYRILEHLHVKPGKGAAFVRTKLKNQVSGNTVEKTFRAGEKVDSADMNKSVNQFTYVEGDQYVFMNLDSFEETRLPKDDAWAKYLKEGANVNLLTWNGKVIDVETPNNVVLKVIDTAGSDKGNTKDGGSKAATLETGAVIQVPLFINVGEEIMVDTRQDLYLSRVGGASF